MTSLRAPTPLNLRTEDFAADDLDLDRLFQQLNQASQDTSQALSTIQNGTQIIAFQVNTPASDWIPMPLLSPWTTTLAVSQGFAALRYRYVPGGVYLDGGCETNGGAGPAVAIPSAICNVPSGWKVDFNTTLTPWTQITSPSTAGGMGLVRATPAGQIVLRAAATFFPAGPWIVQAVLFDNFLSLPTFVAPPMACFPVALKTTIAKPSGFEIMHIVDLDAPAPNAATTQTTAIGAGVPDWGMAASGQLVIRNIPGLALGRRYSVTARVTGGS